MLFHFARLLLCIIVIRVRTRRFEHSAPMRFADALAIAKVDVENRSNDSEQDRRDCVNTGSRSRENATLLLSRHHLTYMQS